MPSAWRRVAPWRWLLALLLALASCVAWATPQDAPASASSSLEADTNGAPVVVWDRTIIVLYAPFGGEDATERAAAAGERISTMLDKLRPQDLSSVWIESGSEKGVMVRAGNFALFSVLPGDVGNGDRAAVEQAGRDAVEVLRQVMRERADALRPQVLLSGLLYSAAATALLALLVWLLVWFNRVAQRRLAAITKLRLQLDIAGFDMRPVIWNLLRRLIGLLQILVILFVGYLWLSFVLRQFPYSRPWGLRLGQYLIDLGLGVLMAVVHQIPNLLMLVVIFLVTRAVVRLVSAWFHAVERGAAHVGWLEAPTAAVTRRLVSVAIWLFALIIAYPHIPGAGSYAFKGVSVFVGVMVSLGSTGIVNQVMSGLVVLYSRAVRVGDYVFVGEHEGTVVEMGALSIRLVTRTREEVTVPNAVLSSTPMRNLNRRVGTDGLLLTTTVTVGYDTPWRQAVALLELAALRTPGVLAEPRPFVLHTALSDFYIDYQLNVATVSPAIYMDTLSDLRRNILDAFNEYGVQVMSPHYRKYNDQKVLVPAEHWYDAPASPPRDAPSDPGGNVPA
ncbi:mechanosensitive ion channel family protein [Dyella sp. C9]|uniref:mechanosensitive ion channel family protein n=1 Tax=Dyella sp. C9 TaxID=2202154 RepID=UPI000DEEB1D2|nr:mechanosensitive ion channel domain-containing protein [Dyella sp. C9]